VDLLEELESSVVWGDAMLALLFVHDKNVVKNVLWVS
jgi:hypothetical protein